MADIVKLPAKRILKQPTKKTAKVTDEQQAQVQKDRQNLNLALQHANRIQGQKDAEAQILEAITKLLDFPQSSPFSARDVVAYISLVAAFQPSDFNSLIEERRIDEKCGYALCSNQPRSLTLGASAAWKLKDGAADFCSTACAKKAMYVKAQLSEVPVWERASDHHVSIQIHPDDRPTEDEPVIRRADRTARVDQWRNKIADMEELAMERGEKTTSFRPDQVMTENVVEKQPKIYRRPVFDLDLALGHDAIEGYHPKPMPKNRNKSRRVEEDDDDDDDDDDEND